MTYAVYKVEPHLYDEGETATLIDWYEDAEHQRAYDLCDECDEVEGAEEEDHTMYIVTHEPGDAAPKPTRRRGPGRDWTEE